MDTSIEQLEQWMEADSEDEHLEFKEAKNNFHSETLSKYCCALANEGGGKLILGVTNKKPREVVGSRAYGEAHLVTARQRLHDELGIRVETQIIPHPHGPVIIFHVPSHYRGLPILYKKTFWTRSGEGTVPMSDDMLKRIYAEATPDFSAQVCAEASFADLEPEAIEEFRKRWIQKSGNERLAALEPERLLADAELIVDGGVTIAALVLFGTSQALGRRLAQAEVIFEYRSTEASIQCQDRQNYRRGFFACYDELWQKINLRNDIHQIQDGLFRRDIPSFNETVIREAILNAVTHRDYESPDPVFVLQYPDRMTIESPGGFAKPVTVENILYERAWRNRRIAETFEKCGLVERSGQGVDLMYERCIKEAKALPDFSRTDAHTVWLTLSGIVEDPEFLKYLEKVRQDQEPLALDDLRVLDAIRRDDQTIVQQLRNRVGGLRARGLVEVTGRGMGTKYLLSEEYYEAIGQPGTYTRKVGLDKEARKQLLLDYIEHHEDEGSPRGDLLEVVPDKSESTVDRMLNELKQEQRIHSKGKTRDARWYPGPAPD